MDQLWKPRIVVEVCSHCQSGSLDSGATVATSRRGAELIAGQPCAAEVQSAPKSTNYKLNCSEHEFVYCIL
jgi:hypothetical protein